MPRQPRHEYAAGFPRGLPTGLSIPASESPAAQSRQVCAADRPISTRLEPARRLRSFTRWFLSYTFSSCLPTPPRLVVPERPGVVRTAYRPSRHLPGQAVLSFMALLRQGHGGGLSPPHGHPAPRGARTDHRTCDEDHLPNSAASFGYSVPCVPPRSRRRQARRCSPAITS
jgi:hypothetical protein